MRSLRGKESGTPYREDRISACWEIMCPIWAGIPLQIQEVRRKDKRIQKNRLSSGKAEYLVLLKWRTRKEGSRMADCHEILYDLECQRKSPCFFL